MFNSTVLEVAAGLCFAFLAVSLATGVIVEALASATKWRSQTLLAGVKELVNDPEFRALAEALYAHALINPRGPGASAPKRNLPSYIDPGQFADALMDVAGLSAVLAKSPAAEAAHELPAALQDAVDKVVPTDKNPQMNALFRGIIQRSHGDAVKIRKELADWFDHGMDRVSGVYKRHAQLAGLVVALILCIGLNINAFRIARTFWAQPGVVHIAGMGNTLPDAVEAMTELQSSFPIGWAWPVAAAKQDAPGAKRDAAVVGPFVTVSLFEQGAGWLITALATLFGAPFWFDALQSVIRLKGSGPSPQEKLENRAAAA